MNIQIESLSELEKIAEVIFDFIKKGYRLYLLNGDLGSGKTTLVQTLGKKLGIRDMVSSPTFSLINAYESDAIGTIYHMDLYRIEKAADLAQLGLEEYLESGSVCIIEWPDIAEDYFYPPLVRIRIEQGNNNIRNFIITTYDTVDA